MQRIESPFISPLVRKSVQFEPQVQRNQSVKEVLKLLQRVDGLFSRNPNLADKILVEAIQKVSVGFPEGSYEFNKLMAKCLISKAILSLGDRDLKSSLVSEANRLDPTGDKSWVYSLSQSI